MDTKRISNESTESFKKALLSFDDQGFITAKNTENISLKKQNEYLIFSKNKLFDENLRLKECIENLEQELLFKNNQLDHKIKDVSEKIERLF